LAYNRKRPTAFLVLPEFAGMGEKTTGLARTSKFRNNHVSTNAVCFVDKLNPNSSYLRPIFNGIVPAAIMQQANATSQGARVDKETKTNLPY